jgi:haloalkane dehalogenase
MAARPAWVSDRPFPFQGHFLEVDGARVHYVDQGRGPVFPGLRGNPAWSFLYRHIVAGLRDRLRCLAPGLSRGSGCRGHRLATGTRSPGMALST